MQSQPWDNNIGDTRTPILLFSFVFFLQIIILEYACLCVTKRPQLMRYPYTNLQDNVMHYVFHATSCGLSSQMNAKDEVNQNLSGHRSPNF